MQDFSHLHTFRGHEHKVMAVAYVDGEEPLCVSGDSEGGIYLWNASIPFGQEPLRKWYEPKDWRYSGIHSLTTSGNRYIYTGSGDKTIKAWSLQVMACVNKALLLLYLFLFGCHMKIGGLVLFFPGWHLAVHYEWSQISSFHTVG